MSAPRFHTDDAIIAAYREHGTFGAAAKALGIDRRGLTRRYTKLAQRGLAPEHDMTHTVPDGFRVKGTSTLYKPDGSIAAQWVKSREDLRRQQELLEAAIAGMSDGIPRVRRIAAPKDVARDLLNLFVVTDYHVGMLAWGEETRGDNWDVTIAENMLRGWFEQSIAEAPPAETAVFAQLGDFLHFDSLESVTPAHRNVLDADTRYPKLVRIAHRCIRNAVAQLLTKHRRVHIIMAEGNHDLAGSVHLREFAAAMWDSNPRVTVDTSPDPYYCVEHGQTSLFFHHGHKRRPKEIDDVFAAKFRDVFGRTKYSYAHMGHLHHATLNESPLMIVEQHRTLAAADAYASRGGWISGRDAPRITYSARFGRQGRRDISPEEVRARVAE